MKPCKICKKPFTPTFNRTQRTCDWECALIDAKQTQEKKQKKAYKAETRVMREDNKSMTRVYKEVQDGSVNPYVRARDQGKGCISCPSPTFDAAGHFIPIGSKYQCNPFRLDIRQIHGQCLKCNNYSGGNRAGYEVGIIERYGQEYLDMLLRLEIEAQNKPVLWTKEEIRAEGKRYRKLTRELLK